MNPQKQINRSSIERFVGENLISKIGIVITIIGVFIGAKYGIEKGLVSPHIRITIGYLIGLTLLGIGIRLEKKYKNYSAVLVGGAFSIFYFITFSAYNFYGLIEQWITFLLLVVCTIFTVITALKIKVQIFAQIGLVGAYAVPFLLSNKSGNDFFYLVTYPL